MQAERLILETDAQGNLRALPKLPANAKVEVIVLILEQISSSPQRQPSARIAGKGEILDDLLAPAVPEEDWDILR